MGVIIYEYELLLATEKFNLLRHKIISLSDTVHNSVQGGFMSREVVQLE